MYCIIAYPTYCRQCLHTIAKIVIMQKIDLGKRHRFVRENILKMSVTTYATHIGSKDVTVYSWENGRTAVPHEIIAFLRNTHSISAGWLLTGSGPMILTTQESNNNSTVDKIKSQILQLSSLLDELTEFTPTVLAPVLKSAKRSRIPLLSLAVSAGLPAVSDDTIEREIDLVDMLIEHPESSYFIRVVGDSMTDAGITDGDTLIVDCAVTPKVGQIVIAKVFGELTVKRYLLEEGSPILRAENNRYKDIVITDEMDFSIVGVVRSCIKQL